MAGFFFPSSALTFILISQRQHKQEAGSIPSIINKHSLMMHRGVVSRFPPREAKKKEFVTNHLLLSLVNNGICCGIRQLFGSAVRTPEQLIRLL